MKKNKIYKMIVCFLIMTFLLAQKMNVLAADPKTKNTSTSTVDTWNIMLLIDKSGSMNGTDRDKIVSDVAKQFIDQLDTTHNDLPMVINMGVMIFGQTSELLYGPRELDRDEIEKAKIMIEKITYDESGTGGTDLGVAVYDAANELKKCVSENSRNMIVMFTDGYSERVLNERKSQKCLNQAFDIAKELGCEIFIIGMNCNNTIKEEGRKEIYKIANTTQLEDGIEEAESGDTERKWENVNYLITDNNNSVREFYGKIYARMIGGGLEFLDDYQFDITTGGIKEVDVTVYSSSEITDVAMLNPDGEQLWEDNKRYFVNGDSGSRYRVIKVLDPEIGTWTVNVRSADENKVYIIRYYGIELAASATWGAREGFENSGIEDAVNIGQVLVTPMYKAEQYKDDSFAESLDVTEFTVSKEGDSKTYPLTYYEEGGQFVGYFPVDAGEYHISAVLSGDTILRKAECDLNVDMKNENAEKEGDADAASDEEKGKIQAGGMDATPWALVIVLLLLAILVLYIIKKKMAYISGNFIVSIENLNTGNDIERTINKHPRGKKFSMWKLIEYIVRDYEENSSGREGSLYKRIEQEKAKIALRKILICKNGNRKRKVYKLKAKEGDITDLSRKTVGYESDSLRIEIEFKRLEEDDSGWGKLVDDKPSKYKKYRRRSSR